MDKNAIKKYAVWAREELIERVSQKAYQYEISADADPNADSAHGVLLNPLEKKQRVSLINKVKDKGMDQVIEEVAYTWFNRFAALRFMEVNNYLPSRVRVFTDEEGAFKPEILTEAIHLELKGLDMEKVYALKEANDDEALFKYLIIAQCNALSSVLPGMFQKIADYTELLFPDNLLREGSVVEQMVTQIPEDNWKDQVQIIGWLYQYYNTEPKDKVFADLKKNKKITKDKIPAATQLFTPDWIVRYMVENSLGRLWIEGHPNDDLKANWKYYLKEAEQEPEVQKQLDEIHKEYSALKPEDILAIDPCMGSGHIICYMFDVLMQIYEAYGYTARDAVSSIVQNNLYGLDIDDRAAQLAYFSVMMKARQYDRRFLSRGIQPHVYAIMESNHFDPHMIDSFTDGREELRSAMNSLISDLHDAKEYGSILDVKPVDFPALYARFDEVREQNPNMYTYQILDELLPFVQMAETMAQRYHISITNPPYMGCRNINGKLVDFIEKNYPNSKTDLFSCFIEKGLKIVRKNGFNTLVTMQSWMFLTSFEKLRGMLLANSTIETLLHMDNMVMGIAFGTSATIFRKVVMPDFYGRFIPVNYTDLNDDLEPNIFPVKENNNTTSCSSQYSKIQGNPIAYWLSDSAIEAFNNKTLGQYAKPRQGMATSDNNRFLRLWFEVEKDKIFYKAHNSIEAMNSGCKWFPYNKGGSYRKWYGNNDYLINWENDGAEVKALAAKLYRSVTRTIKNIQFYFQKGITWSTLSSGSFSARYCPEGFLFDTKGSTCFFDDESLIPYCIAFLNSNVAGALLKVLAPTMDFNAGSIAKLPVKYSNIYSSEVKELVYGCIELSKVDWDSFENSWNFRHHPLIRKTQTLKEAFLEWKVECEERFNQLKVKEEELNRIFIDIYGLQDELMPRVEDKDVTVAKADLERDIRSFVSYAVGCMMGRYSLDVDGLAYAGGEWDNSKYKTFIPDKDAIIPITDDEYFTDDIVGRFVDFIRTVYGEDTLEENLKFIADALGEKGATSREVIRNYFLNDFYKDHCKIYQKRPIYWLFDSGKKNGFKCLIYMHRYQPDTIARIRTDYVHEQQARYRTAISGLERQISGASTSDRVRLNKQLEKLKDQAEETRLYEEKIHHLADQMISIDLDDGVKHNYAIFQDVLAKIK